MNDHHPERLQRALLSLEGLSVGDAFGQSFFAIPASVIEERLKERYPPPAPWFFTDDTVMARAIGRLLANQGRVDPDALAAAFARDYRREPDRGYGGTAHGILRAIGDGVPWREAAGRVFDGEGSCGNGGAMRAGPVGAYFAHDIQQVITEARASAVVTHAHPDGQTGAIAVALASAWAVMPNRRENGDRYELIRFVLAHLPETETFWRVKKALNVPLEMSPQTAALILGNGSNVVSADTVPFCLWCVCRHLNSFEDALWTTVSGLGDHDTTCAIVGSIVSLTTGIIGIPDDWQQAREPLKLELPPNDKEDR